MTETADDGRERLVDDLAAVLAEAEEMLKRASVETGDKARDLRSQVETQLLRAKLKLQEIEGEAIDHAKAAARATDDYVHDHPWQAIGIAASVGLLIGLADEPPLALAAVTDATPPRSPRGRLGLRAAAASLAAALLGLGRTRLELAALEFEEVRARTAENLALVVVAAISLGFAILAASMLVVAFFWDTHRIESLVALTVVYALIALFAMWRLAVRRKADTPAFAATLAELERDRARLVERFGDGK